MEDKEKMIDKAERVLNYGLDVLVGNDKRHLRRRCNKSNRNWKIKNL